MSITKQHENPKHEQLHAARDGMMKNDQEQKTEIEALYIEELGEVRGGIELTIRDTVPLSLGVAGAEGVDRPWKPPFPGTPEEPGPRIPFPKPTTDALGEEGPSPWVR